MRESRSYFAARWRIAMMCAAAQLAVQNVMKGGVSMIDSMRAGTDAMIYVAGM